MTIIWAIITEKGRSDTMEFTDVITKRRAIRNFKQDVIPEEKLQKLYKALQAAPTGNNRQPFKFFFIKDVALRQKIVTQACHQDFLSQPPVLMVACCEKGDSFNVAIAVDHMILAATNEGLGTCWVGWFEKEPVARLLNIPAGMDIPILVPIGYANENPAAKPRKPISEIVAVI
jgi:nitroreductase